MTRMFQSLDLLALSAFFLTVGSLTGQILPPQNVSLRWIDGFSPEVSWEPPPHSVENCTYTCTVLLEKEVYQLCINQHSPFTWYNAPGKKGEFQVAVQTVCNGNHSEQVFITLPYTELVKDLQCAIHSSKRAHCSWLSASHVPDLSFFYRLVIEDGSKHNAGGTPLQACSSYNYNGSVRTGCDLQAKTSQDIHILFNGTLNNKLVRSTFKRTFIVRLAPLNWTVVKNGDTFDINWIPPDIRDLSEWKFIITYKECNQMKNKTIEGETKYKLELVSHCPYCMAIKAQWKRNHIEMDGETEWTANKCFPADAGPNARVYVATMIPLLVAGLAVLTFVCYRKNKDSIFPKVPEPRDFLSDISDNNNKSNVRNLYIPAEEEETCKITLVIDPQTTNMTSD